MTKWALEMPTMGSMREITSLVPYSGSPMRGHATQHQPRPWEGSELGDAADAEGKKCAPQGQAQLRQGHTTLTAAWALRLCRSPISLLQVAATAQGQVREELGKTRLIALDTPIDLWGPVPLGGYGTSPEKSPRNQSFQRSGAPWVLAPGSRQPPDPHGPEGGCTSATLA